MHNVSSTTEEKEGVWSLRGGGCLRLCPRPVGTSGTVDMDTLPIRAHLVPDPRLGDTHDFGVPSSVQGRETGR